MFTDKRSKKVIFVAHCVLNQNAISDGTALYPSAHTDIIQKLLKSQVGIVQLPCPELLCLGLDRGNPEGATSPVTVENTRIRKEMQTDSSIQELKHLAEKTLYQILEYRHFGFDILGIIGINRSPCCGVDTTSLYNKELEGEGLFIHEIKRILKENNLTIPIIGLKANADDHKKLEEILK